MTLLLATVSSIEEFSQARLLELARKELSKIVSESEEEANRVILEATPHAPPNSYSFICPYCNGKIGYRGKKGGRSVICPHKECGRPFMIPLLPPNDGGE